MADDKGGGSPSGEHDWLVLVVLGLLVITLISNIFGDKNYRPLAADTNTKEQQKTTVATPAYEQSCGLYVQSPKPLEKVSKAVLLEGMVGSCEWVPVQNVALYAQVIDSSGLLISDYTTVYAEGGPDTPNAAILGTSRPFRMEIPLRSTPRSKTGFLILVHPDTERATSKTVRIPIRFE